MFPPLCKFQIQCLILAVASGLRLRMETPDSGHTLALAALARKIVVWKEISKTTKCLCVGNGRLGRMQFEVFLGGSGYFAPSLQTLMTTWPRHSPTSTNQRRARIRPKLFTYNIEILTLRRLFANGLWDYFIYLQLTASIWKLEAQTAMSATGMQTEGYLAALSLLVIELAGKDNCLRVQTNYRT